jgi:serine/threonine protein phosphatase PrpC
MLKNNDKRMNIREYEMCNFKDKIYTNEVDNDIETLKKTELSETLSSVRESSEEVMIKNLSDPCNNIGFKDEVGIINKEDEETFPFFNENKQRENLINSNEDIKATVGVDCCININNNGILINVAKKKDKGEDADPLLLKNGDSYYVGVFDGMGGSGATEYKTSNGTHTGAYIASREVKQACEEYLRKNITLEKEKLSIAIKNTLNDCIKRYNIKPSGLRGSIIRTLPTTLAIVSVDKIGKNKNVKSFWCGDSRNYILTKNGMQQISIDNLTEPLDPLENLRNDAALSNCIALGSSFEIHEYELEPIEEPIIAISATDGCFQYFSTPMHFEYMILESIVKSHNLNECKEKIIGRLNAFSGDDFSLALLLIDESYEYWKKELSDRLYVLEKNYIFNLEDSEKEIIELEEKLKNSKQNLDDKITSMWKKYKSEYLKIKK